MSDHKTAISWQSLTSSLTYWSFGARGVSMTTELCHMVYLGSIRAANRGVLTDLRVRQKLVKSNSAEKAEQQQTFVWGLKEQ